MKYHNKFVSSDGIKFHSQREAERYSVLKLLKKSGKISNLELQKKYVLIPKCGKERECAYYADFVYTVPPYNNVVVEDVKGFRTQVYKIKRKLMYYIYGIEILEV